MGHGGAGLPKKPAPTGIAGTSPLLHLVRDRRRPLADAVRWARSAIVVVATGPGGAAANEGDAGQKRGDEQQRRRRQHDEDQGVTEQDGGTTQAAAPTSKTIAPASGAASHQAGAEDAQFADDEKAEADGVACRSACSDGAHIEPAERQDQRGDKTGKYAKG